jgi:hypothetical protein
MPWWSVLLVVETIGKFSQNYSFPSFYYGEYETAHGISLTLQIHLSFPLINNIKLLVQWNLSNQTHQETHFCYVMVIIFVKDMPTTIV